MSLNFKPNVKHLTCFNFYRPQTKTKFAKVMFPQVSVCPQGGACPIAYWDTPPPMDQRQTPPRQTLPGRHPPRPEADTPRVITPWADTPRQTPPPPPRADTPQADTPLPNACWDTHPAMQCMLGYDQQAGGTHSTGMHSCLFLFQQVQNEMLLFRKELARSFKHTNNKPVRTRSKRLQKGHQNRPPLDMRSMSIIERR